MSRLMLSVLFAFAVLSPGCVPVTEPVGDAEKAEPDKNLVGKWTVTKSRGTAEVLEVKSLTVSAPEVKGNPKGLMKVVMAHKDREAPMWFFTSTVGKNTYVNLAVGPTDGPDMPAFDKGGAFAEWKKGEKKTQYFVSRAARDGDKLTLDCGNNDAFAGLMKDAGIKDDGGQGVPVFDTPAGWLAKHLDKNGPGKIFDDSNALELAREKK
jgi:hypothetical protein